MENDEAGTAKDEAEMRAAAQKERLAGEIARGERQMSKMKDDELDPSLAKEMMELYSTYANEYPEDEESPEYLFKAGEIAQNTPGKALMTLRYFRTLEERYPEHERTPEGLFLIGLTFDHVLEDAERAHKAYSYFIEKYPGHRLVPQAENLMAMLEDDEELLDKVRRWERDEKQKSKNQ